MAPSSTKIKMREQPERSVRTKKIFFICELFVGQAWKANILYYAKSFSTTYIKNIIRRFLLNRR